MQAEKFLGVEPKVRKVVVVEHLSPPINFQVHNSSVENVERALLERVFWVNDGGEWSRPPLPARNHFETTLLKFKTHLTPYLPKTTPVARNKFAELYTGRKRQIYDEAAQSLFNRDIDVSDSKIKAFVKAEKINFTAKHDPAPRLIQPCSPRMGVALGRYLKPLEKRIKHSMKKLFGSHTIFKGMNAEQSGNVLYQKWNKFTNPVAVGLDAKRFDEHVSVDALKWEHQIYGLCFNIPKHKRELGRLLRTQLVTKGTAYCKDGKVKYKVQGGRCSGHMNTGMGNCLLMCAMAWSYFDYKGIKAELANNGDDCIVIMEQKDLPWFQEGLYEYFYALGFRMTIEDPVVDFEKIEFCQTQPVYDGSGYVMVRSPKTGLAKDCVSIVYNGTINSLYQYYHILGIAGLHLTGGLPVWQSFYHRMLSTIPTGQKWKGVPIQLESGMMNLSIGMNRPVGEPSQRCRYSFWLAFGITPDEQIIIEKYYQETTVGWLDMKSTPSRDFIQWYPVG